MQLQPVLAQATASQNTEADRLFQEAEQLVNNETTFIQAFRRYQQALRLYRQSGNTTKAIATQQRLETVLAAASSSLAEKFEQEIDQDEAAFFRQFPKTENNQTARQLGELAATQLGIPIVGRPGDSWTISESQQKAYEDIQGELRTYLEDQGQNSTSSFNEVPPKLRDYLEKNADTLTVIRTLLLNNESPRWGTDMSWISKGEPYRLPSYLGSVNLQRIFAIDMLHKQEQGKTKEVQETLEASWKLGQSFKNNPFFVGQLVSIISTRTQLGVMRKLDGLPRVWQQRLLEHDYRQSMLQTLTGESLSFRAYYRWLMNQPTTALEDSREEVGEEFANGYLGLGWLEWSESMQKNFLRWEAIAVYQSKAEMYKALAQENACTWNFTNWRSTKDPIYGAELDQNIYLSGGWERAGRLMVEMELTQKILQIKEMGADARNLPNLQSTICPNAQWAYQTERNGSSIALMPLPRWAAGVWPRLPLIYNW
ncbi:MAG: hypothetical protein HC916_05280 [Coleofasciculaceae cyanobacterium SM2_1_6]|nr:hypothetical protein [Coleofasciculaceae cyanobacterium SM2_1_6]